MSARSRIALVCGDQALVSGCNFLTMLVLVRAMGLERYGAFGMIWTVALFVVGLQHAFVSQPMLSIGPKCAPEERAGFRGAILLLQGAFTALAALGCVGAYHLMRSVWADPALDGALVPGVATMLAAQARTFVRYAFFAADRPRAALANDALLYPLQLAAVSALAAAGAVTLERVLWAVAATHGLATLAGLVRYGEARFSRSAFRATLARAWSMGRWLGVTSVSQWLSANCFLVAAGVVLGSGAVGALRAAQNVIGVLHVGLLAMENGLPAQAARAYADGGVRRMNEGLARVGRLGLPLVAATCAGLALFPELALGLIYGERVDVWMVHALRGFCVLYVLTFLQTLLGIGFRSMERTRCVAACHLLLSLPFVLIATPVVERFGFAGVVVGALAQKAVLALALTAVYVAVTRAATRPVRPLT